LLLIGSFAQWFQLNSWLLIIERFSFSLLDFNPVVFFAAADGVACFVEFQLRNHLTKDSNFTQHLLTVFASSFILSCFETIIVTLSHFMLDHRHAPNENYIVYSSIQSHRIAVTLFQAAVFFFVSIASCLILVN
jgi:hypothetical protein